MKRECKNIQMNLPDYLDRLLPHRMMETVETHINSCNECSGSLKVLENMLQELNSVSLPDHEETYWQELGEKIFSRTGVVQHGKKSSRKWILTMFPSRIPRWAFIGIGVVSVILLCLSSYQNFMVTKVEDEYILVQNPMSEEWFSGEFAVLQEFFNDPETEDYFQELMIEEPLSEENYRRVYEDSVFYFLSQLSEDETLEFVKSL